MAKGQRMVEYIRDQSWIDAGEIAREEIQRKTASGVDANGKPFPPYSREYKLRRFDMKLQVSPVNLYVTGDMMNKLYMENRMLRPIESRLGAAKGAETERRRKDGVVVVRHFLGVDEKTRQHISLECGKNVIAA